MNRKINVVIATNILDIGGAERTVQTLALQLNRELFDVTVLCLQRGGPRLQLIQDSGVRVLVGDGTIEKVRQLIPHPAVDILHFHRSGHREGALHQAVVDYLQPTKLMETNIFAFTDPDLGPRFDLQVYKSMMMLCERVWGGAALGAEHCLKQRVIYNPVTVDLFDSFKLSAPERAQRRAQLGITADEVVLGRIGRNDTVKWGDLILTALPLIIRRHANVKIIFRTVPTKRLAWLQRHKFFNNRVIVLPESSDEREIAATYQLLDIYVHTSRRGEAFGNSLNEAMVWSLPIVVENTPHWDNGQLEQVEHGVTGSVVRTAAGLIEAVSALINNKAQRAAFGAAGRAKVERDFGAPRGVVQYELAYRQLAAAATPAEVLAQMFPTNNDTLHYAERYTQLQKLDFPHLPAPFLEIKRYAQYYYWRAVDSLVSRGFIRL